MRFGSSKKLSILLLLCCGSAAGAESVSQGSVALHLSVPLVCTVSHAASLTPSGSGYRLGDLREFCNAANGYALTLDYKPGTMKNAVVVLEGERVVLDGSGHTVVSRATGPRSRTRAIYAEAGPQGFDTDRLMFNIQPL
jgi:hypothetical protein